MLFTSVFREFRRLLFTLTTEKQHRNDFGHSTFGENTLQEHQVSFEIFPLIMKKRYSIAACWLLLVMLIGPVWAGEPTGVNLQNLSAILNADGTVRAGVHGSFDVSGYTIAKGQNGQPVFQPLGTRQAAKIAGPGDDGWSDSFGLNGISSSVGALAADGAGNVYIGGTISLAGTTPVNNIAKWDGATWSAMALGVNGRVYALALDASSNLYVAGSFTMAGAVAARGIAKWDGTTWQGLSTGIVGGVSALATHGTDVYVGGVFTSAGGIAVSNAATWNGTTWSALGAGTNGQIQALATDASGNVYAGGDFTTAGGVAAARVAKWNGTVWSAFGAGIGGTVHTLTVDNTGNLYAGGGSSSSGGTPYYCVSKWNGVSWVSVGTAITSGTTNALDVDAGGNLYAAGSFTFNGSFVNGLLKWNGSAWSVFATCENNETLTVAVAGSMYYLGGAFATVDGRITNRVAKRTATSAWVPLSNLTPAGGISGRSEVVG